MLDGTLAVHSVMDRHTDCPNISCRDEAFLNSATPTTKTSVSIHQDKARGGSSSPVMKVQWEAPVPSPRCRLLGASVASSSTRKRRLSLDHFRLLSPPSPPPPPAAPLQISKNESRYVGVYVLSLSFSLCLRVCSVMN